MYMNLKEVVDYILKNFEVPLRIVNFDVKTCLLKDDITNYSIHITVLKGKIYFQFVLKYASSDIQFTGNVNTLEAYFNKYHLKLFRENLNKLCMKDK